MNQNAFVAYLFFVLFVVLEWSGFSGISKTMVGYGTIIYTTRFTMSRGILELTGKPPLNI